MLHDLCRLQPDAVDVQRIPHERQGERPRGPVRAQCRTGGVDPEDGGQVRTVADHADRPPLTAPERVRAQSRFALDQGCDARFGSGRRFCRRGPAATGPQGEHGVQQRRKGAASPPYDREHHQQPGRQRGRGQQQRIHHPGTEQQRPRDLEQDELVQPERPERSGPTAPPHDVRPAAVHRGVRRPGPEGFRRPGVPALSRPRRGSRHGGIPPFIRVRCPATRPDPCHARPAEVSNGVHHPTRPATPLNRQA